jgi:hypothetical protein
MEDNDHDNNSIYNNPINEIKKFNIELTVSQANALVGLLPKNYCLQIEREIKNKRISNKKKSNLQKK